MQVHLLVVLCDLNYAFLLTDMERTKFINAQRTKAFNLYSNTKAKLLLKYVHLLVMFCKLNVAVGVCLQFK
jgi:hypothetical protein